MNCSTYGLVTLLLFALGNATVAEEVLLWPEGAPGANGTEAKDKPRLLISLPDDDKATGAAIVVCPGGGYGGLAMGHEGDEIAKWLNSIGVAAFVLDYRHRGKGYGHPNPMLDVQRAIRTVRANADEWKVKPNRIGVLGFSAGGHLASTAATHFDDGNKDAADRIDQVSCRPDFAVLCYAVIAFDKPYTHKGSQNNLLGKDASQELVASMSNEQQVTSQTPPTFLWHTTEDTAVPPENAVQFYLACIKHRVPAEIHIFEKGRHGVGLGKGIQGTEMWSKLCEEWMGTRGLLAK